MFSFPGLNFTQNWVGRQEEQEDGNYQPYSVVNKPEGLFFCCHVRVVGSPVYGRVWTVGHLDCD